MKLVVHTKLDDNRSNCNKTLVYDLRPHFVDCLRYYIGVHDWSSVLSCNDVETAYDEFICTVKYYVKHCIPVKTIRSGRKDPSFITPHIKMLLNKRYKLRSKGDTNGADKLARSINLIIGNNVRNHFHRLADAPVRDMWNALKPKAIYGDRSGTLISDVDKVNEYFANISFDPSYNVNNVNALRRSGYENYENGEYHPLYSYEVEAALSKVAKTAPD